MTTYSIIADQNAIINDTWNQGAHALQVIQQGAPIMNSQIIASGDWSNAATAKADITNSTGLQFPADSAKAQMYLVLWRGFAYPTEYATLYCGDTPDWIAQNGEADPFSHVPTAGVSVTLVGVARLKTI